MDAGYLEAETMASAGADLVVVRIRRFARPARDRQVDDVPPLQLPSQNRRPT
jgi:hypothetical protein